MENIRARLAGAALGAVLAMGVGSAGLAFAQEADTPTTAPTEETAPPSTEAPATEDDPADEPRSREDCDKDRARAGADGDGTSTEETSIRL